MAKAEMGILADCASGSSGDTVWRTTKHGQVVQLKREALYAYLDAREERGRRSTEGQQFGRRAFRASLVLIGKTSRDDANRFLLQAADARRRAKYKFFSAVDKAIRPRKRSAPPNYRAAFTRDMLRETKVLLPEGYGERQGFGTLRNFTFIPETEKGVPRPIITPQLITGGIRLNIQGVDSYKGLDIYGYWCFAQLDINPYLEWTEDQLQITTEITLGNSVDLLGLSAGDYVVGAAALFKGAKYATRYWSASSQTVVQVT